MEQGRGAEGQSSGGGTQRPTEPTPALPQVASRQPGLTRGAGSPVPAVRRRLSSPEEL